MNASITQLAGKTASQASQIPSMYGRVDFSITPERFTAEPGDQTELAPESSQRRPELLANEELVARIKAYTMIGDRVADAYAALIPEYGFRRLATMLEEACAHGLESVSSAPPELVRFIKEMERFPAWLDMKLIEQGARIERNAYAHRAPFVIRGAPPRNIHEQIFRFADGPDRRPVEQDGSTPGERDSDIFHDYGHARRARASRRWLQSRGDGSPHAFNGQVQHPEPRP